MSNLNVIDLYVTHIQKEGFLLKIFGQNDRQASIFVEKLLIQFTEKACSKHIGSIPRTKNDLRRGMLCCARFDDGKYYRAKVKDLQMLPPNIVTLSFVDYGNTRNVELCDIRLINNGDPLSTLSELAAEYYLAEVVPPVKDWEDSTVDFVKEKLNYVELRCQILSEVCGKKLTRIYVNNIDFKHILIQHGLALQIPLQVQQNMIEQSFPSNREIPKQFTVPPPNIVMSSLPPAQPTVITHMPRNVLPPTLNMVQPTITPAAPNLYPLRHGVPAEFQRKVTAAAVEPQHFVCDVLQPGSTHYVYISHVEDGPVSFAVQLKPFAENELTKLMAELNDHEPKPISGPLIPGSPCLGRFSEDRCLCRASVMHVMDDKCKVYYVDYGNSEVLPYSQIYEIPPKYLSTQVMATRFTLSGTRNTQYTNDLKDFFKKRVTDKLLFLKVTPTEGNPLKQYCELFLDGQNVKDLLLERMKTMPLSYEKIHTPIKGTRERVIVSYVENVQKVFVQFEEKKVALKNLMANLGIHCNSGQAAQLTQDRLFAGLPCCALYSGDQLWYRAQVLSVIRDAANILFVDYGNQETVPTTALREITRELVTDLSPQALQCSLNGFQEGSDRDQALTNKLDELAAENVFTMVVVDVLSNQTAVVDLINDDSVSLATLLSPPLPSRLSSSSYSSESSSFDQGGKKSKVSGRPDKGQQRLGNLTKKQNHQQQQQPAHFQQHHQQQQHSRSVLKGTTAKDRSVDKQQQHGDNEDFNKKPFNRSGFDKVRGFDDGATGRRFKINDKHRDDVSYVKKDDSAGNWKHKERDWKNKDSDWKDGSTGNWKNKNMNWKEDSTRNWKNRDSDWKDDNVGSWKNKDRDWKEENVGSWKNKDRDWKEESTSNWKHKEKRDDNRGDNWKNREKDWGKKDKEEFRGGGNFGKQNRGGDNWGNRYSDKENDNGKTYGSSALSDNTWDEKPGRDSSSSDHDQYSKRNRDYNHRGKFNSDGGGGDFNRSRFENKESGGFKFNSGRDNFRRDRGERDGGGDTGGGGFKKFNIRDKDDNFSGKKMSPRDTSFASKFESTSPVLSIPSPTVGVGCCEIVEPVSTVSPYEFYVQLDSSIDKLEELQQTIADTYGSGGGEPHERLKKRTPCIAQFSEDQVWYRGVIEAVYASSVSIVFVDYGNKEDVKMDNLKAITSNLCELPRQAIKCSLFGSKPSSLDEWSEEEAQLFMDTVLSKKLKAQFVGKTFLSNALQVVVTDVESGVNINTMFGASEEAVTEAVGKMNTVELKDLSMQLETTQDVQITWFISPSQFYVQPLSTNLEFRAMVESLQEVAKRGKPVPTNKLQAGDLIIARYKEDKVLYRARVKETGLSPVVQYIDYGNHEKVESGNVWSLEPQFRQIPVQAICCSLAGVMPVEETWPKTSDIDSYFDAEQFSCTFLSHLDGVTSQMYSVKLVNGEKDVAEQLIANNLAVEGKEQSHHPVATDGNESSEMEISLLSGQNLCVKVCHVENAKKFYVHLLPMFADSIQEQIINAIAEKQQVEPLVEDQMTCGALCLTLHSDGSYYRSTIIDTSVPIVQFIDIGSVHHTSFDKVYNNLEELSKIPGQAMECALSCLTDIPDDLQSAFKTEVENKKFIISVDTVQNDILLVKLFERSGALLEKFQSELKELVEPLEPVCPLPILRSHHKVYITDANDRGIYLQKSEHSNMTAELLSDLYDYYNETEYTEQEWKIGMLCCALSNADNQWYRARVMSVEESNCNIHYIDYGNYETVGVTNLRKLESTFYDPHTLALCVTFHVEWVVPIETLMELVSDKEYSAVILKNSGKWIAELMDLSEGHSLTEKLVELGFVTVLDNSPFERVVEGGRFVEGSMIPVSVTHIDSPSQIWLFVNGDVEIVEELQDRLQEAAFKLKNLTELPSSLFAAKYTDGMWYRSVHLQDSIVRFVDYGNTDSIDISDIKELSPEFLEPSEGYAIKCELLVEPKEDTWPENVIDRLDQLLISEVEDEITAHVLAVKESSIVVDLKVGEVSVTDLLLNENLADKPVEMFTGYVCHTDSLQSFYIQQQGCDVELSEFSESLLSAENFEPISNVADQVGQIIAAKYTVDDQWYRAKVLNINNDGSITVVFIDYGNCGESTEFRSLPQELASKECLARHCALIKPSYIKEWPEVAAEKFGELIACGSTAFTVKVMVKSDPDSVILIHNDHSVALELSKLCQVENEEHTVNYNSNSEGSKIPAVGVVVTHVNSPNDFYVQYKSCERELIDLNEKLKDVINSDPVILNEENMSKILAAQSSTDREWYRVKVAETKQTEVEVFLIDYGVSTSSTKLRQLPCYLENKPPLAVHCSLNIDDCSEGACEKFKQFVENSNEFNMELIEEGKISVVNLHSNDGCDIKETLLNLCQDKEEIDNKSDLSDFAVGYIAHVNSPSDFYIYENGIDTVVEDLEEKLSVVSDTEPLEISNISVGSMIAAIDNENNKWRRGKVLVKCDDNITVLFIDYGNSDVSTDFRTLPPEFLKVKPLALHCSLQYPEGADRWSQEACDLFFDLASGGVNVFEYKILEEGDPNIIILLTDRNSVEEMLSKFNQDETDYNMLTETKPDRSSNSVYVSHVNDPCSFYIQYKGCENCLEEMVESLSVADVFNTVGTISKGDIIAAECPEDGMWYRGKVIDQNKSEIKVLFIDYGKISSTYNVRQLPTELIRKQPLAKHCSLHVPGHMVSVWSQHVTQEFDKLVDNGNVEFQLKVIAEGDTMSVDLISEEGSLSEILGTLLLSSSNENNSKQSEHSDTKEEEEELNSEDLKDNSDLTKDNDIICDKEEENAAIKEEHNELKETLDEEIGESKKQEKASPEITQIEENDEQQKTGEKNQIENTESNKIQEIKQSEDNGGQRKSAENTKEKDTQQTINDEEPVTKQKSSTAQHVENIPST